jgi:hypothetical protein
MFFRCRRPNFLLTWIFLLFGFKIAAKDRLSEEERTEYRNKAKRFRKKFRDALAVWDDEDESSDVD